MGGAEGASESTSDGGELVRSVGVLRLGGSAAAERSGVGAGRARDGGPRVPLGEPGAGRDAGELRRRRSEACDTGGAISGRIDAGGDTGSRWERVGMGRRLV